MSEPTLAQIFGSNAVQTADELIIKKSDLTVVGLTPATNNTPESLLTAMILKAGVYLTTDNRNANSDQSIVIGTVTESITTDLIDNETVTFTQFTVPVELYKAREAITINPMNY